LIPVFTPDLALCATMQEEGRVWAGSRGTITMMTSYQFAGRNRGTEVPADAKIAD